MEGGAFSIQPCRQPTSVQALVQPAVSGGEGMSSSRRVGDLEGEDGEGLEQAGSGARPGPHRSRCLSDQSNPDAAAAPASRRSSMMVGPGTRAPRACTRARREWHPQPSGRSTPGRPLTGWDARRGSPRAETVERHCARHSVQGSGIRRAEQARGGDRRRRQVLGARPSLEQAGVVSPRPSPCSSCRAATRGAACAPGRATSSSRVSAKASMRSVGCAIAVR